MGISKDISGKVFGNLTVIKDSKKRTKFGRILWLCECSCGTSSLINSKYLLCGDTKSCGCLTKEIGQSKNRTNKIGDISKNFWSQIKGGAKSRNIEFNLTREEAWELFLQQDKKCALSGRELKFSRFSNSPSLPNRGRSEGNASLDRIDSSFGYYIENVQWVHKRVNLCKHVLNNEDFISLCEEINNHNKKLTVCVSGGMDCLHWGHLKMINEASKYGKVIVILNSDEWLTRKKGKPFMKWEERAEIVRNLSNVYKVVKAKDDDGSVCESLKEIKPDYFANGGDRKLDVNRPPEVDVCEELGIKLIWNVGGGKVQSSSDLIKNASE